MATTVYEESRFSTRLTAILATITVLVFALVVYQFLTEPDELRSMLGVISVVLLVLFATLTVNFRRLSVHITDESVTIGYGVFRSEVPWRHIEGCSVDETSTLRYGGWGIRVTRVGGSWRLVYNTMDDPRVVMAVSTGRFREIAFSTRDPETVVEIIERHAETTTHE